MLGFGHHAVLGWPVKVVEAVEQGAIKHFFLIGGCDGVAKGGTQPIAPILAESGPQRFSHSYACLREIPL